MLILSLYKSAIYSPPTFGIPVLALLCNIFWKSCTVSKLRHFTLRHFTKVTKWKSNSSSNAFNISINGISFSNWSELIQSANPTGYHDLRFNLINRILFVLVANWLNKIVKECLTLCRTSENKHELPACFIIFCIYLVILDEVTCCSKKLQGLTHPLHKRTLQSVPTDKISPYLTILNTLSKAMQLSFIHNFTA